MDDASNSDSTKPRYNYKLVDVDNLLPRVRDWNLPYVIYVYSDECDVCNQMQDEWEKFFRKNIHRITIMSINVNSPRGKKMKVSSVPFIAFVNDKQVRTIYNGDRTETSLTMFITDHLSGLSHFLKQYKDMHGMKKHNKP